ncbi:unnamed protein product [Closterium sp. Naga37s-1]|nr:unnamed protein product [Closterium sp. Naga37s-1]
MVAGIGGGIGGHSADQQQPARPITVAAAAAAGDGGAAASSQVTEAPTGAKTGVAAAAGAVTGGGKAVRRLEELEWESTFVDKLPGDPVEENHVRNACYSHVRPSLNLKDPQVVAASDSVAHLIGLDPNEFTRPEFAAVFTGGIVLQGCKPYAQCYGGHQFGSWAGQLGDGRAITLGEVVLGEAAEGGGAQGKGWRERWELQLKGVGKTPYSRHADGRAVLRSSIREYLCSEAMAALGVPTTRALSVVTTGEKVLRDMFYNGNAKFEPGAAVCRVAPSFIRFGSFQLHASRGGLDKEMVRVLADYTILHHFPHLADLPEPPVQVREPGSEEDEEVGDPDAVDVTTNKYAAWFAEVAKRTGELVAGWQAVGFTHGVLNTDNMSILGLTIDYGPFGFLDSFDPDFTPNTSDMPGRRYCFRQQPDIGLWNVVQLANTLVTGGIIGVAEAQHGVSRYAEAFLSAYQQRMAAKLGLPTYNKDLTQSLLQLMAKHGADFTNTFRSLARVPAEREESDADLLAPMRGALGLQEGAGKEGEKEREWVDWLRLYTAKLRAEKVSDAARRAAMDAVNPAYILRNYQCQLAIEAAEQGDFSVTQRLQEVLQNPYEEQPGAEEFAQPPPEWALKPGCVKPVASNRVPLHVLVLVLCFAFLPAISAADSGAVPVASLVRGPHRDVSRRREESDRQLLRSFEELSAGTMAASGRNAEDMLRDAIDTANSQRKTITVHLTPLPSLGFNAGVAVKGSCTGSAKCVIDGRHKYFVSPVPFLLSILHLSLVRPLPSLGFNAGVAVKGSCAGSAKCVIDGRHKFAVFSGGFNCFISLEQVTVRNAVNGVHTGGCAVTARRVTFINNVARTTGGGAVVNSRAASPTSGALLFTFCEFVNNTAESGNGGAINVGQEPVGGPRVQLAGCAFRGNRAEKGKGGAIYSEDNVLYMNSVKFEKNYALVGGGAIATTAKGLTIVKSTFFKNVAVQPPTGRNNGADSGGGAILVSSRDSTLSLCSTSIAGNRNNMRAQAGDIAVRQLAAGSGTGSVSFCSMPAPANVDRAPGLKIRANCKGCTGCANDCNGHGTCVYNADFTPSCQCVRRWDNETACATCVTGYTRLSSCRACSPGFFATGRKNQCAPCAALDKVPGLRDNLQHITGMVRLPSYKQCQQQCLATQVQQADYCNLWAYIANSAKNGDCGGKCIMFHDPDDCGVGKIVANNQLGVWYQYAEPSFNACS